MSNDINYNLIFSASKKRTLLEAKSYLDDKKSRWDNRGDKTAADLLEETGLQNAAEVVTWGFDFGEIQKEGDSFSVEVTSWANENSLGNIWISGPEGELHFLMERFPELEISGRFTGDYGRGSVCGSELGYESWGNESEGDQNEDEPWEALRNKNQALKPALSTVSEAGGLIEVALPQDVAIQFCSIPEGSFTMGSPVSEEERDEYMEAQVEVTIKYPFWLAKTEVTQEQFEAVMGTNPSNFVGANRPVENVSWEDAEAFIARLNEKRILPQGWKFALPTEAQWEYACRAGEKGPYSGGGLDEVGWYEENSSEQTHEVGLKKPNAWGLYDMHGNVCEWCTDWSEDTLQGGEDPVGPDSGSERTLRGGSWAYDASGCRAAYRGGHGPKVITDDLGFRPAIVQCK